MTPTQIEHLRLIDAHLKRLLDIAAKRTPGEWKVNNSKHGTIVRLTKDTVGEPQDVCRAWNCSRKDGNATFIASCAGNAEAGWRATRVAIAALSKIAEEREPVEHGDCGNGPYVSMFRTSAARFAEQELESILAAFPLETLNPQKP